MYPGSKRTKKIKFSEEEFDKININENKSFEKNEVYVKDGN